MARLSIVASNRVVSLVLFDIGQRTTNALCNPPQIRHGCAIRVHKNIKRRNALHERAVFGDNLSRLSYRFGTQISKFICGLTGSVCFNILFNKTITSLHPTVTNNQSVFNGTTELFLTLIVSPPIVHNRFSNNSVRGLF